MFWYKYCYLSVALILFLSQSLFAQKLTLQQSIEEALAHNPEIMKGKQTVKAAKAKLWEGISPENPKLFAEFEGIPWSRHSLSNYGERKVGFVQEFEFPLIYYFKGRWHQFEIRCVSAEYLLLQNKVISEVKKKFYKVLLLEKQLQLYKDIKQLTQELYRKTQIRVKAGESPYYDELKMKVDLAEVENRALAIRKQYEIALNDLALFLGRKHAKSIEIEGELLYSPISLNQDSLQRVALESHPHLKETQEHVNQKKATRNLSWIGLIPNIEIRCFQQEFQYEPLPKVWGAEIGVSLPLWFFLKDQGKASSTIHELEAAKWQLELDKRKVIFKVKEAFSKLILAEKQVQNYQENVLQEVEELVRIATISYEQGEMGYLDVAEALRTLNRTKAGYSEALFKYLAAQADLERAIGVNFIDIENY